MSATTNRLIPVLPEANGLYINLALLDSALGSNFSETLQISNVPLLSTIQNFMKFSSQRMKLDSVADSFDNSGVSSTTDLLNCQDEKPMMTFGIADYPSLGFKEELAGVGTMPQETGSCDALYGSLSKFVVNMNSLEKSPENNSDPETSEWVYFTGLQRQLQGVWLQLQGVWLQLQGVWLQLKGGVAAAQSSQVCVAGLI
jgi:hypothetical protein